jgi:hypothetical protein
MWMERFPFMHANVETLGSFHTRRNGLRKSCEDVCVRYDVGIASSYKGSKTITRIGQLWFIIWFASFTKVQYNMLVLIRF